MSAFRGPLYKEGLLTRRALVRALFAQVLYLYLGASEQSLVTLGSSVLKLVQGWQREQVVEIIAETLEQVVEPIIYAEALDLIDRHRIDGREVVIVSASPEEIVHALGRHLGVSETIGSTAEVDEGGRYTGAVERYAYGPFKAEAVRQYCERHDIDLLRSYAYSDSKSDIPMLELVGNPVVVNPDRELLSLARERGWEVRHFLRPVRLRDRVFERVHIPARPSLWQSVSALAVGSGLVGLSWWLTRGRRSRTMLTPLLNGDEPSEQRRYRPRTRREATTPSPTSKAMMMSFFSMSRMVARS